MGQLPGSHTDTLRSGGCCGKGADSEQLGENRQRECGHSQPLPEPVPLAGVGVAADGVVLVGQPNDEDDVECSCGVIEELRHYGFHTWGTEGTSEPGRAWEGVFCLLRAGL